MTPTYEIGPPRGAMGFPWFDEHRTVGEVDRGVPPDPKAISFVRGRPKDRSESWALAMLNKPASPLGRYPKG